jgi:hypothetical protein
MVRTIPQILRCLTLGRYTARVEANELRIRGPQPLAGPLPASIKGRRDELIAFLEEETGGVWPPASESTLRTESLDCGLATALDAVERARREAAA